MAVLPLISPLTVPVRARHDVSPAVSAAIAAMERSAVTEVSRIRYNDHRLELWRAFAEYAQANVGNIEGQLAAALGRPQDAAGSG
jgi:hypothetical protein